MWTLWVHPPAAREAPASAETLTDMMRASDKGIPQECPGRDAG